MFNGPMPITTPLPLQVYPLRYLPEALRFMASGKSSGKIVLDFTNDDEVPVSLQGLERLLKISK